MNPSKKGTKAIVLSRTTDTPKPTSSKINPAKRVKQKAKEPPFAKRPKQMQETDEESDFVPEEEVIWDDETQEDEMKEIDERLKKWVAKNGPMDFTHLYRRFNSNEDYARWFYKQYDYIPEYILKSVGGKKFITTKPEKEN